MGSGTHVVGPDGVGGDLGGEEGGGEGADDGLDGETHDVCLTVGFKSRFVGACGL